MKKLRKYHKWPSLIVGFFLLLFCTSGIIMNHRSVFASLNFPRQLLPGDYHYKNWNLASVKSFLTLNDDSLLAYGNVGIWKTDKQMTEFKDFNAGFGKGIDHRKIFTMAKTSNNRLFAGTLFGLYEYNNNLNKWVKINLPVEDPRIVKVLENNGKLIILSRSEMWEMDLAGKKTIKTIEIPASSDYSGRVGMFRTFWVIHSGELFGTVGKLIVDLVGLSVIFMTLSGFFYTFLPKFSKSIKDKTLKKLRKTNRKTINWHTLLGVYGIPFLLITVITGMFLRPPLLIPIVNKEIAAIPGSELATENAWHDKLRDITYDTVFNRFIISTSEGFISFDNKSGKSVTQKFQIQPPVSVMGINAFEHLGGGDYLVASFSGIYRWNPATGNSIDMITGMPVTGIDEGNPFGRVAVAGIYMEGSTAKAILDYGSGWMNLKPGLKPQMPEIISNQPISWWNLALEIHTGRIFSFLFGNFYILYVPLMGLTVLLILVTGFLMYWKSKKRKEKSVKHGNTQLERSAKSTV